MAVTGLVADATSTVNGSPVLRVPTASLMPVNPVAASISLYFVYYVLQQMGFAFGGTGQLPPWVGAWLPNLFFGAMGLSHH